jgi:arginine utilization protein RocB
MEKRYSPATCLKIRDMRKLYSVTLLDKVAAVFNVLMVQKSPSELLYILQNAADMALDSAISQINKNRISGGYQALQYSPKVVTYADLLKEAAEKSGKNAQNLVEDIYETLADGLDTQERSLAVINELVDMAGITGPSVVVGFLSPYCQPRLNLRKTEGEKRVLAAVEAICEIAAEHGIRMIHDEVYEGISDLSEMGYQGSAEDISLLTGNMAGFGADFSHPFEAMSQLDIPVLNLGPIGKDAHKQTERVDTAFLTEVLPILLKELLKRLGV